MDKQSTTITKKTLIIQQVGAIVGTFAFTSFALITWFNNKPYLNLKDLRCEIPVEKPTVQDTQNITSSEFLELYNIGGLKQENLLSWLTKDLLDELSNIYGVLHESIEREDKAILPCYFPYTLHVDFWISDSYSVGRSIEGTIYRSAPEPPKGGYWVDSKTGARYDSNGNKVYESSLIMGGRGGGYSSVRVILK